MSEHDRRASEEADPRDEALDRLYREAVKEAPPGHLDAGIRAAARREAGARPQRVGVFSVRRWRLPVALAAVLVLSVSLVTMVQEQGGGELEAPPAPAPATSGAQEAEHSDLRPAPMRRDGFAAKPAESPVAAHESESRPVGRLRAEEAQRPVEPKAAGASAGDPAESVRPAAPAAAVPQPPAAPSLRERKNLSAERDAASSPLAKRPPPSTPAADALSARQESLSSEAGRFAGRRLSPEVAREVKELEGEPAGTWLERIATLRKDGRTDAADELLAEFRRRFPGHDAAGVIEK